MGYDSTEVNKLHIIQENLIISEKRLKAILDSTKEFHVFVGLDYKILSFNEGSALVWLRWTNTNIELGKDIRENIPPLYKDRFDANSQKAMQGERVYVEEKFMLGNISVWASVSYVPIYDDTKTILGFALNIENIDEKKKKELEVIENEKRLSLLAENFPEGTITLLDTDFNVLYTGGSNFAKHGVNPKDLIGRRLNTAVQTDVLKGITSVLPSLIEGNSHSFEVVFRGLTYLQTIKPILGEATTYKEVVGFVIVALDITERKQMEKEVKESQHLLSAIHESINYSSILADKNFKIVYANQKAREGAKRAFSKEMSIGDYFLDYMPFQFKEEFKTYFYRVLLGEKIEVEKTTNSTSWFSLTFLPVYNSDGEIFAVCFNSQEITDRKQKELKIIAQNESLRAIAWHQSHVVRRPLANILALLELLKDSSEKENTELLINYIEQSAKELDQIIYEIVIEANKQHLFE